MAWVVDTCLLIDIAQRDPAFGAASASVVNMHVHAPIPRLPEKLAGYQGVIDRLLAKKPEERFQTARELFGLIAV